MKTVLSIVVACILYTGSIHSQSLENRLNTLLKEANIPGLSLSIIDNGTISDAYHLGFKSMDSKSDVQKTTVFSAASLSKCILGYMVLELSGKGVIDLDAPLMDYYNYEDIVHDDRSHKITARMVLTHTTGLPNWRNGQLGFINEPGENFGYSGEGFVWLQRTIEHITGKNLETLASEMVFTPLQMSRTSFIFKDDFENDYALPHDNLLKTNIKNKIQDPNAAHSLQTTSTDYAKFLIALVNSGFISMFSNQQPVSSNGLGKINWGLGVGIQETDHGTEIWHWGDNGTFKAYFTINPETKDGLVYFANGSNGLSCTEEIVKMFLNSPQPSIPWNDYPHFKSPLFQFPIIALEYGVEKAIKPFLTNDNVLDTSLVKFRTAGYVAWQWLQSRELDLAHPLLTYLKDAFPDEPRVPYNLIRLHLMQGSLNEAKDMCRETKMIFPDDEWIGGLCQQLTNPSSSGKEFKLSGYQNAKMVSVVGPFNNWDETSNICLWKDGSWQCFIDLKPGEYEYKFRVDGVNILDPLNPENRHKSNHFVSVIKMD